MKRATSVRIGVGLLLSVVVDNDVMTMWFGGRAYNAKRYTELGVVC